MKVINEHFKEDISKANFVEVYNDNVINQHGQVVIKKHITYLELTVDSYISDDNLVGIWHVKYKTDEYN